MLPVGFVGDKPAIALLACNETSDGGTAMADLELQVSADLPDSRLDALARELARDLSRAGLRAAPVESPAGKGERGVLAELGKLAASWAGKLPVATIVETVKSYLVRERSLRLKLTRPDGSSFELDAKNIDSREAAAWLGLVRDTPGGADARG